MTIERPDAARQTTSDQTTSRPRGGKTRPMTWALAALTLTALGGCALGSSPSAENPAPGTTAAAPSEPTLEPQTSSTPVATSTEPSPSSAASGATPGAGATAPLQPGSRVSAAAERGYTPKVSGGGFGSTILKTRVDYSFELLFACKGSEPIKIDIADGPSRTANCDDTLYTLRVTTNGGPVEIKLTGQSAWEYAIR